MLEQVGQEEAQKYGKKDTESDCLELRIGSLELKFGAAFGV